MMLWQAISGRLATGTAREGMQSCMLDELLTMMSTRLAMLRSLLFSPKALTRVVMFFLASGRLMARMTGLRGLRRNLNISCRCPHGMSRTDDAWKIKHDHSTP